MNEEQKQELNKQQQVYALVLRVAGKLKAKATIEDDIKDISKELESKFDIKGSHIVALAKELVEQTSTKAVEKHNDIVEDLDTLKTNQIIALTELDEEEGD